MVLFMTTEQIQFDTGRKRLIEDFVRELHEAVDRDSSLVIDGTLHAAFGSVLHGQNAFAYTDVTWADQLEMRFGRHGMLKGQPADLVLKADVANQRWTDYASSSNRYTNQELASECLRLLHEIQS